MPLFPTCAAAVLALPSMENVRGAAAAAGIQASIRNRFRRIRLRYTEEGDFAMSRFALLLALAGCSASTAALDPLAWQKVPGPGPDGAVLGLGSAGAFDERSNFTVSAFKDGDTIRL